LHHSHDFKVDTKVKIDVLQCIQKIVVEHLIDLQLKDFKNQEKLFGNLLVIKAIGKKTPAACGSLMEMNI